MSVKKGNQSTPAPIPVNMTIVAMPMPNRWARIKVSVGGRDTCGKENIATIKRRSPTTQEARRVLSLATHLCKDATCIRKPSSI